MITERPRAHSCGECICTIHIQIRIKINCLYVNIDAKSMLLKMEIYNLTQTSRSAFWKMHLYKERIRFDCKWNMKDQYIFYFAQIILSIKWKGFTNLIY
jgi:hypothetical protein